MVIDMYDYLNADFIRGYTKAIQDIQCIFESVHSELAWRKIPFNYKRSMELLDIILQNRMQLREQVNCYKGNDKESAFIRWNISEKALEFYDKHQRKKDITK